VIVLGIETAGPTCSVALVSPETGCRQIEFEGSGRLGAELAPTVQRLLSEGNLGAASPPDLIAVDTGPGSYTGLRIGLAAAKGLAFAWGRPLIGIPTADALSAQGLEQAERVLCAMDASRGEVFAVLYTRSAGRLERQPWERLAPAEALVEALPKAVTGPTLVLGDAAHLLADPSQGIEASDVAWPTAERIARLALHLHMEGERQDALQLCPIYYRPNEAEEQRRKRKMRSA
jgi:tRNA threonylcarbamoyladenosine biosynthesis protein TsaB